MLRVTRVSLLRYGVAVLAVALALLLKLLLSPLIGQEPFLLFFAAIMTSAWYGGMGPGVLATVLAALISDYFFLSTTYPLLEQGFRMGVFVLEGLLISALSEALLSAKRAAEASEERYRLLVEGVADYAIIMLDCDGRVAGWNAGAERVKGYKANEIIGQHFSVFYTKEDQEKGLPAYALKMASQEGRFESTGWRVRKDGTRFWTNVIITALKSEAGDLRGFSELTRDITERKLAEEQLRRQLDFTNAITNNLGEGVYALDREGCVTFMNPAAEQMLGWKQAELLGKNMHDVVHFQRADGTHLSAGDCPLLQVLRSGTTVRIHDDVLTRRDGTTFPVSYTSSPIISDGQVAGAVLAFHDITARKQLEDALRQRAEELAQANQSKDEFMATLSHELRTPLSSTLGWARLLRTGNLDETTRARALETIERNAKSQVQLIEDLLDISRIIAGKLRLNVRPTELAPIIEAVIDTMRPAADAKAIRVESVIDPGAGAVTGDPDRLHQVVSNLLSNAIKFTPKGGRVEVRLERADSYAQIKVSDTGQGISADFLPHVFDRFRQGDSKNIKSQGGLGLGLAIVRHLVELHGGTVRAESPGEGRGATFTVRLPLAAVRRGAADSEAAPTAGAPFEPFPSLDGLLVLVVDDEADAREFLTTVLKQCGAGVLAVASAGEALDAIVRLRPDVLVSDIGMPGEDGYVLIRKVRALEAKLGGGRIPAVALTAYARVEDRMRALAAGFHMHVPKPVEPAELATVIANLAGRTEKSERAAGG